MKANPGTIMAAMLTAARAIPATAFMPIWRTQSRSGTMAAMLAVSAARTMAATAFVPIWRTQHHASVRFSHHPPNGLHQKVSRRCHQFSLTATKAADQRELEATTDVNNTNYNLSPQIFVDEVTSFLETDGIPWRHFSQQELRHVLELYFEQNPQSNVSEFSSNRVNEIMTILEDRVILAVGEGARNNTTDNTDINRTNGNSEDTTLKQQPYSFILHLCCTPNLDTMQKVHQKHNHNSSVSQAVATHAWLNAHLTNAFFNYDPNNIDSSSGNKTTKPKATIVHLHQDVWNRSPTIVRSRLSSKCGRFHRRIYARQTIVKRIPKSQYIPFLEDNHLWGATGAKYCFGLFLKPKKKHPNEQNSGGNTLQCQNEDETLVAVATFSSKRKINRASHNFHSFELIRFCTKLETTVVGGLNKLVAGFVKDVTGKKKEVGKRVNPTDNSEDDHVGIDIITSIDRDFGSNTWPDTWQQMEVMDPVPMFVGDVDGLRRHAVGAGLTPLEQTGGSTMTTSMVLRAGLPDSLGLGLGNQEPLRNFDDRDWPWQMAALHGFHPVFDAGVERLMLVVDSEKTKNLSSAELWQNSVPSYVKEHYSSNTGIDNMLSCIRHARSNNDISR